MTLTHSTMTLRSGQGIDIVNEATLQHESEMREAIDFVLSRGPISDVIEIGVWEGGSAHIWAQVVGKGGHVYAIDEYLGSESETCFAAHVANKIPPVYRGTEFEGRVVEIEGRFEDPATIARLENTLSGKKVDILFHDGDHTYEAAKRDIEEYSRFVKDGGWIVVCDWMDPTHGVSRYWPELIKGREFHEFVIQRQPPETQKSHRWQGFLNGIGIVRWTT